MSPKDRQKYEDGQLGSDHVGLHLEKGLAWSLAVSERLSPAWHAGGWGWHVPACYGPAACLLSSIMKQQEIGLGIGVSWAISCPGPKASL